MRGSSAYRCDSCRRCTSCGYIDLYWPEYANWDSSSFLLCSQYAAVAASAPDIDVGVSAAAYAAVAAAAATCEGGNNCALIVWFVFMSLLLLLLLQLSAQRGRGSVLLHVSQDVGSRRRGGRRRSCFWSWDRNVGAVRRLQGLDSHAVRPQAREGISGSSAAEDTKVQVRHTDRPGGHRQTLKPKPADGDGEECRHRQRHRVTDRCSEEETRRHRDTTRDSGR